MHQNPSIPVATRDRIEAIAREIGYRPDPLLSALANRKKTASSPGYRATLAWVTEHDSVRRTGGDIHVEGYFRGAKTRAEQLGFVLDEIRMNECGQAPEVLTRVLTARGIRGLLLPPQAAVNGGLHVDWTNFCSVTFGTTLSRPQLHGVAHDYYRSVAKLVGHLAAMGFRKPLFFFEEEIDRRVDGCWSAGFRFGMGKCGLAAGDALRPVKAQADPARIAETIRADNPDVLLVNYSLWEKLAPHVAALGIRVPTDMSVAVVTVPEGSGGLGGITDNAELIGSMAIDVLTGFLQRGDYGLPSRPFCMMVEGEYTAGRTIVPPPAAPKKSGKKPRATLATR